MTAPLQRPARARRALVAPGRAKPSAITIAVVAALLVMVQAANSVTDYRLNEAGIRPRSWSGLWGILDAPLLHHGWSHLWGNLVPLVIFGFLILVAGLRQFIAVTALIWLLSGFGVWLTAASGSVTVGASTLVFGWLAFLVLRGFFARQWAQIAVGIVLLALWGGIFWGILPGRDGISWQGHLFGALAGGLAAFLVARADAPTRKAVPGGSDRPLDPGRS